MASPGGGGVFLHSDALSLRQLALVIRASYFEAMRVCARYTQSSTEGTLAYTWTYFACLGRLPNSRAFHIGFGCFLTALTIYTRSDHGFAQSKPRVPRRPPP